MANRTYVCEFLSLRKRKLNINADVFNFNYSKRTSQVLTYFIFFFFIKIFWDLAATFFCDMMHSMRFTLFIMPRFEDRNTHTHTHEYIQIFLRWDVIWIILRIQYIFYFVLFFLALRLPFILPRWNSFGRELVRFFRFFIYSQLQTLY